mgnify:CR=1 FL=1
MSTAATRTTPELTIESPAERSSGQSLSLSEKAAVLASGQALSSVAMILTMVVLARVFSQRDYATYQQTMLTFQLASPLLMLGLHQAMYYFLPLNAERSRQILAENLLLLAGSGLICSLFFSIGGRHWVAWWFDNPDLASCLLVFAPYFLLMLPAASLPACLMAWGRAREVAAFNAGSRLLMFLLVVIPSLIWPRPLTAVSGAVAGAGVCAAAALLMMGRACRGGSWQPTLRGLRSQLAFGVPLGLAAAIGLFERSVDKLMVAAMASPEDFSIYVNGALEIPLIGVVTSSVTSVLIPEYTRLYAEGRLSDIVALMHRAMTSCALVILPAMAFLFVAAGDLMVLLFGPTYEASAAPFRVYLLLLPVRTLTFGALLMAMGKGRCILIQTVATLAINVPAAWLAIRLFGSIGAAIAAVGAVYLVSLPYLLLQLRRWLHCPIRTLIPWRNLGEIIVACGIPIAVLALVRSLAAGWPELVTLLVSGLVFFSATLVLLRIFHLVFFPRVSRWIGTAIGLRG